LVFRNGQLLNNDQYNLTDTNQITIVSTSFKVGANYTVATVSGIGSIGTGVFPNPVYPEAGIALSTGSAWASSIPNNSNNWNIAYNDKINNAVFTGTDTKTLTLTQLDGGTFAPTFTDLQGIVAGDTASMLLPYLRRADTTNMLLPYFRDADTTSLNLTSRFAAKQNILNGTGFVKASGTNITYDNSSYLRTGLADSTYLKLTGGTLTGVLNGTTGTFTGLNVNNTNVNGEGILTLKSYNFNFANKIQFGDGSVIRREIIYPNSTSNMQFRSYTVGGSSGGYDFYVSNGSIESVAATIGTDKSLSLTGTLGVTGAATLSSTLAVTGDITENGNNVLTSADTTTMLAPYTKIANAITGSGTLNYLPFYSSSNTLSNSIIRQPNTDEIFVDGDATFNNGVVQAQEFRSPFTVSSSCGSSGGPNLIGTSTGNYVNICSTGTAYLLLPDPAVNFNRLLTITNLRSDQSIVLNTSGSYSNARPLGINSASESSIPAKRWITVQSNGLNWYIIATGSAL
jgi:hypothetical protein